MAINFIYVGGANWKQMIERENNYHKFYLAIAKFPNATSLKLILFSN